LRKFNFKNLQFVKNTNFSKFFPTFHFPSLNNFFAHAAQGTTCCGLPVPLFGGSAMHSTGEWASLFIVSRKLPKFQNLRMKLYHAELQINSLFPDGLRNSFDIILIKFQNFSENSSANFKYVQF
jgi:hypothetical protein